MLRNWSLRRAAAAPPMTNLAAWYKKGTGITDVANAVSAWADQSGNTGRDLVQATGANQPAKQADGTILFNGTSHYLKTSAFTLNQPETVYLRAKLISGANFARIFDGNTADSMALIQAFSTNYYAQLRAGLSTDANFDLQIPVGNYASVVAVFNGNSSVRQIDSTTVSPVPSGATNAGGFALGARPTGALFTNIQVAEALIYSEAHDAAQRSAVFAYLASIGV
jgi:hypothetical protein